MLSLPTSSRKANPCHALHLTRPTTACPPRACVSQSRIQIHKSRLLGTWTDDATRRRDWARRHHPAGRRRAPDLAAPAGGPLGHRQRGGPRAGEALEDPGQHRGRRGPDGERSGRSSAAGAAAAVRVGRVGLAGAVGAASHLPVHAVRPGRRGDGAARRRLEAQPRGGPGDDGRLPGQRHRQPGRDLHHQCRL
ncbi:hypothetical protein VTK73DRAFT_6519 [Phialemonium thermophilum]|uniref:Uncharacterized protein n=1 Tax=Phialemonium thermophilum TaxID=223376 RepID=A0ABR3UZL2_9PEZI